MAIGRIIVGAQNVGDTQTTTARGGRQGDIISSSLHGSFYEQTFRGNVFSCANQAAVTTTGTLATTFTGLAIANPAGSGSNLVVIRFAAAQFAAGAAAVIGVSVGSGAAAGSLTIRNRKWGGASSIATASAGATITAPVLASVAGGAGSAATTAIQLNQAAIIEFDGSLIIPPGYFMASDTSIATTAALIFEFVWEEVVI